jgi:uncharacterized membrane protein required for colicin V production
MPLFAANFILQHLGDLVVVMCMVGLAIFGWYQGLFLATLAGLQVLASCMLAMAFAVQLTPVLLMAECPPQAALAVSFLLVFLGSVIAIRLAIGAAVPEGAVRFSDAIDKFGGTCIGLLAGATLAGALLIAWSMAELPESFAVRPVELKIDPGSKMIHAFARCSDEDGLADRLLQCYDDCDWKSRPAPAPAERPPTDAPVPEAAAAPPTTVDSPPAVGAVPDAEPQP